MTHSTLPPAFLVLLVSAWLTLSAVWPAAAGAPAQAPAGRTVWDGIYTDAQAERGQAVFEQSCARCHTLGAEGNRPLAGDRFWQKNTQRRAGDLLAYISTSMPNGNGGSLPPSSYNDVLAAILKSNGLPAGPVELAPAAIADVLIVPKDGPGELPANTLVRVVGCLAKDGSDWVLTHATAFERTDKTSVADGDATRPLGDRRTTLKFVLTRLDAFVGQRMSVTGMLIGAGGSGGVNVATVTRVAETCP